MKTRVSGASVTITAGKAKVAGVLRTLKTVKVMDGGSLRLVATLVPDLTASAIPLLTTGTAFSNSAVTITSSASQASPNGGSGPYSYAWSFVSSTGGSSPTILSPSVASTTFQLSGVSNGQTFDCVFRCTITDAFGTTATVDVTASFANFGSII